MWNKIKQFWNWLLVKVGYRKALIIEKHRSWPYEDRINHDDNLVYLCDARHLESALSRKFKNQKNNK